MLWVAPDTEQLPAGCRTFIDTKNLTHSGVGYVHDARAVMPVLTETVSAELAAVFARSIAPVIDLGARHEDSSDLPRSISFLAMEGYGGLGDQPDAVIERWNQNHSILTGPCASEPRKKAASLRAAVGHTAGHLHPSTCGPTAPTRSSAAPPARGSRRACSRPGFCPWPPITHLNA